MTDLFSGIKESLSGNEKTIILPEGTDVRVLEAASRLHRGRTCEASSSWQ